MQSFTYSTFSAVAIVIHLIINFDTIIGRGEASQRGSRYRIFLIGVLVYYISDAAWGLFAGLGWTRALYVATLFFFFSLSVFAIAWCRFTVLYLGLEKWAAWFLVGLGYALLAAYIVSLAANFFNGCVFYFDDKGTYLCGWMRNPLFHALIAYNALLTVFAFAKAVTARGSARSRDMMVFANCVVLTFAVTLQVLWPLTPFTALGCLVGNCFLHIFVVQDERAEKHAEELEKALEQAQAADKARSLFFSIVSHDIRTPLNAILGYAELLQDGKESLAERKIALKSIRASGTTLLQLVNDVLDLAKMDAGRMSLHRESVLLYQLTDEVFSSFWRDASEKGVELVNRTETVPTVLIDGHRFRQILFNLIGNAVKFTARGSVTVAASYSGTTLEVSVADTGCGIPPDMLTHILDPFVQVQDPSHASDRAGGTGLGLSICKRLVEAMGGALRVESEIGKGSTFTAVIPGVRKVESGGVESGGVKDLPSPTHPLTHSFTPKHVLVVDDSPVNRSVLKAFLRRAGVAEVDFAGDGVEALSALDSAVKTGNPYDLVFSDFWMPNMNGLELVERLRADPRFSRLRMFAVTADTEFGKDARSRLFNGILLKPLTYSRLVDAFSTGKEADSGNV